jgi:hypothetical protein
MNHHPNVGTIGHIDLGQKPGQVLFNAPPAMVDDLNRLLSDPVPFKPTHWPPRLTRMALAVRLGTTRMLLERRP